MIHMEHVNQYTYFLQNLNGKTYSFLKSLHMSDAQKHDSAYFFDALKKAIYGDEFMPPMKEVT